MAKWIRYYAKFCALVFLSVVSILGGLLLAIATGLSAGTRAYNEFMMGELISNTLGISTGAAVLAVFMTLALAFFTSAKMLSIPE